MQDSISSTATHEVLGELTSVTQQLIQTLDSFEPEAFNRVPFEGSWTAGQVAEHLFQSQHNLPSFLQSNTRVADRGPDEKVDIIKSIFLDFSTKLKSPDFILPTDGIKEKKPFIDGFGKLVVDLESLVPTLDLSMLLTDFPFPEVGELTRYEWLFFSACHSKRHIRQLNNIYRSLQP